MRTSSLGRGLLLAGLLAASAPAVSQVASVTVKKGYGYVQSSATDVVLDPAPNNFGFGIDVNGDVAGIPTPTVTGPFNLARMGPQYNNGKLVYSTGDGGWRFGLNGNDIGYPTQGEIDADYPNGTYTVTVNGAAIPLTLGGNAYPNKPVLTLSGGTWSDGSYVIDASRDLTITTNAYGGWGSHVNDMICILMFGPGMPKPFAEVAPFGCNWGYGARRLRSIDGSANFLSFTVPAGRLQAGNEYVAGAGFMAIVDSKPDALPGSTNVAYYEVYTVARIKVVNNVPPPVFPLTVASNINATTATATATFQPRPQDVGTNANVYVFAVAPASVVKDYAVGKAVSGPTWRGLAAEPQADPVACVLAQLNASGQLQSVGSAANLQAALSGVLTAQGQTVTLMNNVATPNVAGATFYVGYGTSATAMINGGVNRSAVTVPGSVVCQPQPPQTGWWWNPAEDGRGFSVEVHGNNLFFAAFLYDVSGRSTWYVATGPVSIDGSLFSGDLLSARGGQTLGGPYPGRPALSSEGPITLSFNSANTGTMVWPGGSVPIQRFDIIPNGLASGPNENLPEGGWWWNEQESGRGFFLEWQKGTLDIAGYMYDDAGNSVWYLTVGDQSPDGKSFSGNWWSYGNGQTLTGAWRQNARLSTSVAPMAITFSAPDTAIMTLPNGRTTALKRHRF